MAAHKPIRCLALSVDIGAGHRMAAEAISEALLTLRPGSRFKIVEALDHLGPAAGKIAKELYFGVLEELPDLWGMLYQGKGMFELLRPITELMDDLRTLSLTPVIRTFEADVILALHPIACGLAAALGRGGDVSCPLVAVLTDFDAHPAWIARGLDLYLAPTPEVAKGLSSHGLETGRAEVTGIPLRTAFARARDQRSTRQELGLDPGKLTILLLGGGLGLGPIVETAEALGQLDGPVQLALVCGKNRQLEQEARALAQRSLVPLHVQGMADNIWEYMAAADLAISKPGGLTCAELLASGVPLVALDPIPGQEQANCDALVGLGVAVPASSASDALVAVKMLLGDPARLREMGQRALTLGRPNSARDAARQVISMVEQGPLPNPGSKVFSW